MSKGADNVAGDVVAAEEALIAYAEGIYRIANSKLSPVVVSQWVRMGLDEVRSAHPDFDAFAPEMADVQRIVFANLLVLMPAEWFDLLYTVCRHAGFTEPCRIIAAERMAADSLRNQAPAGDRVN